MPDRGPVDLRESERQALEAILSMNVKAIRSALAERDFGEVCALCLHPTPLDIVATEPEDPNALARGLFSVGDISIETTDHRADVLAAEDADDVLLDAWNGEGYDFPYEPLPDDLRTPEFREAEAILAEALARSVRSVGENWVFNQVAAKLTREPPVEESSANFIAFFADEDFGEGLLENLWAAATPAVADALVSEGLLFRRYEDVP